MTSTERGTPITDAAVWQGHAGDGDWADVVFASVARQLESDLRRAQEERDRANDQLLTARGARNFHQLRATELEASLTAASQEAEQRGRDAEELRADLEWLFNFGGIHGEEEFEDEIVYYFRLDGIEYRAPTWYEALKAARAALSPAREV